MERKRIIYIDDGRGIGGAEKNLICFLSDLSKEKIDPLVIVSSRSKFYDLLCREGIKTRVIESPVFLSTSFNIGKFAILNPLAIGYDLFLVFMRAVKVRRCVLESKAEAIQTNGMFEHICGGIAGRLSLKPCIWFMQDIPRGSFRFIKRAIINLLAWLLASKIVAVSGAVKKSFYGVLKKKINVVYVGINIKEYNKNSSQRNTYLKQKWQCAQAEYIVGIAGRLVFWKGAADFIKAAAIISKNLKGAKFIIIGDAIFGKKRYKEYLKLLCKQLGLEDKVIFTGFLDNISEGVDLLDVFVHCPLYPDPCPIGLMEAGILKKAIVATRTGGIPEIIEDKREGILVEANNHSDLAKEVINLLKSPDLRKQIGEKAYSKVVNEFVISKQTQGFMEIYKTLK